MLIITQRLAAKEREEVMLTVLSDRFRFEEVETIFGLEGGDFAGCELLEESIGLVRLMMSVVLADIEL